jgi:hypothetical protein
VAACRLHPIRAAAAAAAAAAATRLLGDYNQLSVTKENPEARRDRQHTCCSASQPSKHHWQQHTVLSQRANIPVSPWSITAPLSTPATNHMHHQGWMHHRHITSNCHNPTRGGTSSARIQRCRDTGRSVQTGTGTSTTHHPSAAAATPWQPAVKRFCGARSPKPQWNYRHQRHLGHGWTLQGVGSSSSARMVGCLDTACCLPHAKLQHTPTAQRCCCFPWWLFSPGNP